MENRKKPTATSIFDELLEKNNAKTNKDIDELYKELSIICQLGKVQAIAINDLEKRVQELEAIVNEQSKINKEILTVMKTIMNMKGK